MRRNTRRPATASSEERRALPWVKVDKDYVFDGPSGKVTLADLFKGRSQLVVQHFMFAPDWDEGCKSCSFWADGFERMVPHLAARDTTLVAISRAPLQKLDAFKARMGWTFDWVSSGGSDFNYDYAVSFTPEADQVGRQDLQFRHLAVSASRRRPASACSTATRPATSSTPIPASPAAST